MRQCAACRINRIARIVVGCPDEPVGRDRAVRRRFYRALASASRVASGLSQMTWMPGSRKVLRSSVCDALGPTMASPPRCRRRALTRPDAISR